MLNMDYRYYSSVALIVTSLNRNRNLFNFCGFDETLLSFDRQISAGQLRNFHNFNSTFVAVPLYSLEVCPLNKADMPSLDFCISRLLMKLLCTCRQLTNRDILLKFHVTHYAYREVFAQAECSSWPTVWTAVYFYFIYFAVSPILCFLMKPFLVK